MEVSSHTFPRQPNKCHKYAKTLQQSLMWISKHMTVKFTIHRNLQTFLSSFALSSLDETNSACKSCTLLTNSSSFCFCFWIKTPPNKQFSREKKYERKHRTCETILSETCINRRSSSLVERSLSWNSRNQGFQMNTKKKKTKTWRLSRDRWWQEFYTELSNFGY